ncbi:methylated-DNA--[protein]-cysteine S-methyltransferase [Ancylomarina sp. DW003]|nr:methylated-DNA--[protein]-cysteine S-methyltransferase [Ancylomarina sp. DW003]MDE5421566.1 methylated-DNA--[protein]-cysteine S-methyltransferase [Ancylomarina sp. DW003]
MQLYFDILSSPIGNLLLLAQEFALKEIVFPPDDHEHEIQDNWIQGSELLEATKKELKAYFEGHLKEFSVQVNPDGTPFQIKIWKEVMSIPFGSVCSYQDVANGIDNSSACRAVGRANSQNPIPIIIPCHRVIGKSGKLTGYSGGLHRKEELLKLEGIETEENPNQYKLF